MTIGEFIILLVMAAILGILTQRMMGYKLGGTVVSIVLGFLGAFVGMEMTRWFHLPIIFDLGIGDHRFPVIWSFLGCMGVTFTVGFIARGAARREKKKK
ncbi:MAG TPA: hypothetical protein VEN81_14005 [Planctomycetota bacterium]|nr:hypothetical protein [Planctomycetota bacterium]